MTEFTQSEPTYEVDFNNAEDGGRIIKASLWRCPGRVPDVGQRVFLRDNEGNTCWATVDRVVPPMIYFAPDDSTWVSGDRCRGFATGGASGWSQPNQLTSQ